MKKLILSLLGTLTLTVALPAIAGPDFQAIEHARKAQQAAQVEQQGQSTIRTTATGEMLKCPPEKLVLFLDHGPRAMTKPYLNQKRKERHDMQVKACWDAAA